MYFKSQITDCVDLCLCVRTCTSDHTPHLSSKKTVQLCSFAAGIPLHNRQQGLKQRGFSAPRTLQQAGGDFSLILSLFSTVGFSSTTMAQPVPTDPTKMGVGRAIAVLTSGGDAQGEYAGMAGYVSDWKTTRHCMYGVGGLEWSQDSSQ